VYCEATKGDFMAGRPKIQFTNDADGSKAWSLIEKIQAYHHTCDTAVLEKEISEIRKDFPNAKITSDVKKLSAAEVVLKLLEAEANRIDEEERHQSADRDLEDHYKRMGKAVVKNASGRITGVQG
jgi:hypothetical protein